MSLELFALGLQNLVDNFLAGSGATCNILRPVESKNIDTGDVTTNWTVSNSSPVHCAYYGTGRKFGEQVAERPEPLLQHTFVFSAKTDLMETDRIQVIAFDTEPSVTYAIDTIKHETNAGLIVICSLID
jgi:hypothetical protein